MKLIKLHTTKSTNLFLKNLVKETLQDNFTVVVTDHQSNGKGQFESVWCSEPFKNLTFSVYVSFRNLNIISKKYLNFAISVAVFEAVFDKNIPNLKIKWPNDILSENKKICGILIENQIRNTFITSSIIGVGLNVNQSNFDNLPNASSMINKTGFFFELDALLKCIVDKIKQKIDILEQGNFNELEQAYFKNLYKYQKPSMFKDIKDTVFMAKIVGISIDGKLQLEVENGTVKEFGLKELKFI